MFSTLHTNDAASTLVRLRKSASRLHDPFGSDRRAGAAAGAQELPHCRVPETIDPLLASNLGSLQPGDKFLRAMAVINATYWFPSGRMAIYELMVMNDQIRSRAWLTAWPVTSSAGFANRQRHGSVARERRRAGGAPVTYRLPKFIAPKAAHAGRRLRQTRKTRKYAASPPPRFDYLYA